MKIEEKKEQLRQELGIIEDPYERFAYVIDRGKDCPPLDPSLKIEAFRVDGCMSALWVAPEFRDGLCYFHAESDSQITHGIANLLCELYSGEEPEIILQVDPAFFKEVGITQHLSHNRRNGLTQVAARIQSFARSCLEAEESPADE
jgi:cysteine desulfuration protein SufE